MDKIFLNIGCGNCKLNGFINIDLEPTADLQLDVRNGLPFDDDSVDGIYSEHFIEHLTQSEAVAFLRECRRILKYEGALRISTPDLSNSVQRYLNNDWREKSNLDTYGFGWLNTPCEYLNTAMREWGHKWLYDETEIVRLAKYAGFYHFKRCESGISKSLPLFNNLESRIGDFLIIEAKKRKIKKKSDNPLVSIFIPAYNYRYFSDALESSLNQSYDNIEIIIGDDSHSEKIKDIVEIFKKKYPAKKIHYFREEPPGQGERRNVINCLSKSKGELIKPLYDDDLLEPRCVERMVEYINRYPSVTLVTSYRQVIDSEGRKLPDINATKRIIQKDALINGSAVVKALVTNRINFIGEPSTVMFRKEDLTDEYPDILSFAGRKPVMNGDVAIWMKLLSKGDCIYIAESLSNFRLHKEQTQQQPGMREKGSLAWEHALFDAKRMGFLSPSAPKLSGKPLSAKSSNTKKTFSVSIIIPVFNKVEYTKKCIDAIYKNTKYPNYEIIIVNNGSIDCTDQYLQELDKERENIRIIHNEENLGFAKANNQAASIASCKYLVFLNNDTEVLPGWLTAGVNRLKENKEIGIVGAKLLYPDQSVQHAGLDFYIDANPIYSIWPLHRFRGVEKDDPKVNKVEELYIVTGACLFIERDFFYEIGCWDIEYGMYFEDTDLCFKARAAGKKVVYDPNCVAIHYEGKTLPNKEEIDRLNIKAAKRFFKKWKREVGEIAREKLIDKKENNYIIFKDKIEVKSLKILKPYLNEISHHLAGIFESLGPIYVHFGGIGDACLLLSTFYDDNPEQVILSIPNSIPALKNFFSNFPKLKKIYFSPYPKLPEYNSVYRQILHQVKNVKGLGATPFNSYFDEWTSLINIFQKYGIKSSCKWVKTFKRKKITPFQVVLNPKGSSKGMVKGKNNKLNPTYWKPLINFLNKKNIIPIILGTPDETKEYPAIGDIIDKRSFDFKEQMELIASSDLLIGTDTWGKTFSTLAEIPTIVFETMRSKELQNWKDPADYIFIDPWDSIIKVKNLKECKKVFYQLFSKNINITINKNKKIMRKIRPIIDSADYNVKHSNKSINIIWEGSQFVYHSLALVNREQSLRLINAGYNVSIFPYETDQFKPDKNSPFIKIAKRLRKKLPSVDVHVRHQWPPNLEAPEQGHWVVIQPWEFGSLPKEWVKIFSEKVDEMWVPSNYVRKVYIDSGIPEERVFVVPNGIDSKKFNPNVKAYNLKTKKKFKFLFVGGTIFRKGIDILLDVYTQTFNKDDDVCLVIKDMGGKSFYKGRNMKEHIQELQKKDNTPEIEYIDTLLSENDLIGLYTASNVLVHPYRGEGFGLPVLEAMACGIPAIVTNGAACLDFCNESNSLLISAKKVIYPDKSIGGKELVDNAWLYEPDKTDLGNKMIFAYRNPEQNRKMGNIASKFTHLNFTWDNSSEILQKRIIELVRKPILREKKTGGKKIVKAEKYSSTYKIFNKISTLEKTKPDVENESYHDNHEKINCPFCNSEKAETYRRSADIVRCVDCNTIYLRTRLKKSAMESLYQSYGDEGGHAAPQNETELLNHPLRREYFLKEILNFIKPQGEILDIGCCWGAFLHNARREGFNVHGIELTQKNVNYARTQLKIDVSNRQFDEIEYQNDYFDLITMLHVLEHIPYPKFALGKVFNILKTGGMFCGIVPNIKSFLSLSLKDKWYWLDPNYHYLHFSPMVLKRELINAGFEIERMYTCTGDYDLSILQKVIKNIFKVDDPNIVEQIIKNIEKKDGGEEIRFFSRKPKSGVFIQKMEISKENSDEETLKFLIKDVFREVLIKNQLQDNDYFIKAVTAKENNNIKESIKYIEYTLMVNPDHAGAYNLSGIISFESGDLENAKKLFATAIEKDPKFVEAQRNFGDVLLALEDYDNGVQTFMTILKNHPDDMPTLIRIAQLFLEVGKNSDAALYLEKAKQLEPNNNEVLEMFKHISEEENGEQSNLRTEVLSDDRGKIGQDNKLERATNQLTEGNIEQANLLFREVLLEKPQSEDALFGLALCARYEKDNGKALEYLNRLIKINPNCADAFNQSGLISFETGDFESAKTLFIAAIEKDPTLIEVQRNYGEVLLALEDYENGVNTFVEILKNHPDDVPSLIRMAQLYTEVGKDEKARQYAAKVLEYDCENKYAFEILNTNMN